MLTRYYLLLLIALVAPPGMAEDDPLVIVGQGAAPVNVTVEDVPNDGGESFVVKWSPTAQPGFTIFRYEIYASESASGPFVLVGETDNKTFEVAVLSTSSLRVKQGGQYWTRVAAIDSTTLALPDSTSPDSLGMRFVKRVRISQSPVIGPVTTLASWINWNRLNILILVLLFYAMVMLMVKRAKKGGDLRFRRIAGIDAIDEAIGRATELGKPVMYIPGTQNIENIQTIASIQLLTSVASKAANYDIPIIVPLNRAFMVTVAEEAVKQGFLNAGRPDAYVRDNIRYLSDEQFAFTSGVTGMMMREKTAAHFYLGAFFAESLILSETGFVSGAIQIAGTANVHQLPFFVVACDYTLIGEEYFATSALVTRDVEMMGTLKATDYVKAFIILCLVSSLVLEMFGVQFLRTWFQVI